MIRKDLDEIEVTDKFARAGRDAERQMAFYLKREFSDKRNVMVLNNIRLELEDDAAQIDHLLVFKYGMIIVESKSIIGKVMINTRGEWSRQFEGIKGMASPIKQGERQASFLRKYLNAKGPDIVNVLGFTRSYDKMPIDVLVAISDSAIIQRQRGSINNEVLKADLIPDKINDIIRISVKEKGPLSLSILPFTLSDEIIEKICSNLNHAHKPLKLGVTLNAEFIHPSDTCEKETKKTPTSAHFDHGFCIRCGSNIKLDPKFPYCRTCYASLKTNQRDHEKYCHICGKPSQSVINKPCCFTCFRENKDKLDFFLVQPKIVYSHSSKN